MRIADDFDSIRARRLALALEADLEEVKANLWAMLREELARLEHRRSYSWLDAMGEKCQ